MCGILPNKIPHMPYRSYQRNTHCINIKVPSVRSVRFHRLVLLHRSVRLHQWVRFLPSLLSPPFRSVPSVLFLLLHRLDQFHPLPRFPLGPLVRFLLLVRLVPFLLSLPLRRYRLDQLVLFLLSLPLRRLHQSVRLLLFRLVLSVQ